MIQLKDEVLAEMPVIWADPSGKYKLVKSDENNMEIIVYARIGESGRGRATTPRDCWCSIPAYYSRLPDAFNKMLEIKTQHDLIDGMNDIKKIVESMRVFKEDFAKQCDKYFKV